MRVDDPQLSLGTVSEQMVLSPSWYLKTALTIGTDRVALLGSFPGLADGDEVVIRMPTSATTVRTHVYRLPQGMIVVLPIEHAPTLHSFDVAAVGAVRTVVHVKTIDGDIAVLLRSGVATLPEPERLALLAFLVRSCGGGRETLPFSLAADLQFARHTLREPRIESVIDPMGRRAAKVEVLARIDAASFYIRGWIGHGDESLAAVHVVSPEGAVADLTSRLARFTRGDVAEFYGEAADDEIGYGFAAYFSLDVPSPSNDGWVLEVSASGEPPTDAPAPMLTTGDHAVRDLLVADLAIEQPPQEQLRRDHLKPAITRLLDQARSRVRVSLVRQFGDAPVDPDVTVIVPLYRRIDFLEHQLAQFVHDPDIAKSDVLYVLDSPELRDELLVQARRLWRLYRVPFRVAVLSRNGGFSAANNLGAQLARGRLLLLMNSDVVPDRPGWLGQLTRFHDSIPDVGAVGPKLLFEDDSIQHAGMYFALAPDAVEWSNEHYFKGFHRSFPPACVSRQVPAVTAACMLISKDEYDRVGGLDGHYVQGDFEDSDLCLRLHRQGRAHWYAADVELYHLEGQSYPTPVRVLNGQFNRWLHTHLWDDAISEVMTDQQHRDAQEA